MKISARIQVWQYALNLSFKVSLIPIFSIDFHIFPFFVLISSMSRTGRKDLCFSVFRYLSARAEASSEVRIFSRPTYYTVAPSFLFGSPPRDVKYPNNSKGPRGKPNPNFKALSMSVSVAVPSSTILLASWANAK